MKKPKKVKAAARARSRSKSQYINVNKKGVENGTCNLTACQRPNSAIWYNHGSFKWYCESCRRDIEFDEFNMRDWMLNWFPKKQHPMFETRNMIDLRTKGE